MTLLGVEHIGVAVRNVEEASKVYSSILGFKLRGIHILSERKVKIAFMSSGGETDVELLEPLDSESTVAKFLETRGEGIHHIAVRVSDIEAALSDLKQKGVTLIDEKPRKGAEGKLVAFVHPKSTRGVLLELVMK
ncbi:MAG: methylmalonyl-CoA epimerase [Candidatus Bathyarchaeota archaeon]|nr:methylmalonyl-CoA epimerase [Candidatus Bathyarchaeota archaeon]